MVKAPTLETNKRQDEILEYILTQLSNHTKLRIRMQKMAATLQRIGLALIN